jgi:hypothetical protein
MLAFVIIAQFAFGINSYFKISYLDKTYFYIMFASLLVPILLKMYVSKKMVDQLNIGIARCESDNKGEEKLKKYLDARNNNIRAPYLFLLSMLICYPSYFSIIRLELIHNNQMLVLFTHYFLPTLFTLAIVIYMSYKLGTKYLCGCCLDREIYDINPLERPRTQVLLNSDEDTSHSQNTTVQDNENEDAFSTISSYQNLSR